MWMAKHRRACLGIQLLKLSLIAKFDPACTQASKRPASVRPSQHKAEVISETLSPVRFCKATFALT